MIDEILHILGLCPDHHNHISLMLFLTESMNMNLCWCHIKNYLKKKLWIIKKQ
jgi:hypothetical protein